VRVAGEASSQRTHYVPSRDGRRFLINTPTGDAAMVPITVVLNWTAALKKTALRRTSPQFDQVGRVCPGVSPRAGNRSTFLDDLVSAAGGRAWSSTSSSELRSLFTRALDEMRARYLVTFSPQGVPREGWHDLKVRLRSGRADITTRRGYFVPPRE
jgi:sugar lactone lactonase YvrE